MTSAKYSGLCAPGCTRHSRLLLVPRVSGLNYRWWRILHFTSGSCSPRSLDAMCCAEETYWAFRSRSMWVDITISIPWTILAGPLRATSVGVYRPLQIVDGSRHFVIDCSLLLFDYNGFSLRSISSHVALCHTCVTVEDSKRALSSHLIFIVQLQILSNFRSVGAAFLLAYYAEDGVLQSPESSVLSWTNLYPGSNYSHVI